MIVDLCISPSRSATFVSDVIVNAQMFVGHAHSSFLKIELPGFLLNACKKIL